MDHMIHRFESIGSTMTEAVRLAEAGCESGTVVVANEQTHGYGRQGRSWYSEAGSGLYLSEVLRPKMCPDSLPVVTLAIGLAAADAITSVSGLPCDLRWPNDVLLRGKKCAGILVQLHGDALLAGIGINVNHTSLPPSLASLATSLRIENDNQPVDRDALLDRLLSAVDGHLEILLTKGKNSILEMFSRSSSFVSGRRVVVDQGSLQLEGVTEGLDPQGFLILREDSGKRSLILAGGVRPACS